MGTKKSPKNTPENQTIEQLAVVRKNEMLGQLLTDFYIENESNAPLLKNTVEIMFDTYVTDNENDTERTDAVWFTQAFIDLLRNSKGKINLQQRGRLLKKHILETLKDGNPNIVEDMFYRSIARVEESMTVEVILHFYRSFQRMIEGVKVLNGKSIL